MFKTVLTFKQTDMMKHAWGYHSREPGYRSHYCTSLTDKNMTDLVEKGYFAGPFEVGQVGEGHGVFVLTEKGVAELLEIKKTEDEMKKRMKERQA